MTVAEAIKSETITPPPRTKERHADAYQNAPDDLRFEIVDGVVVEKTMSAYEVWIASHIHQFLAHHCRENDLGRAVIEMMFEIPGRPNDRKPDVAFVSYDLWPRDRRVPSVNAWDVIPELVVEVVSPHDAMFKVLAKVNEYFEAGVKVVWLIVSNVEAAYVYTSPTAVTITGRDGELTGSEVVPGFRLALAELFPREA